MGNEDSRTRLDVNSASLQNGWWRSFKAVSVLNVTSCQSPRPCNITVVTVFKGNYCIGFSIIEMWYAFGAIFSSMWHTRFKQHYLVCLPIKRKKKQQPKIPLPFPPTSKRKFSILLLLRLKVELISASLIGLQKQHLCFLSFPCIEEQIKFLIFLYH